MVIYTRPLRPWTGVILLGICNFLGVFIGGIAVALSIINLLPVELLVADAHRGCPATLLALLLAAIASDSLGPGTSGCRRRACTP